MVLLKYRINYRLENEKSIKRTEFERVLTLTYLHSFLQTFSTITKHITLLFIIHSYCAVKPLRTTKVMYQLPQSTFSYALKVFLEQEFLGVAFFGFLF